jgi:superoxide dismutase, Cu-Zn family
MLAQLRKILRSSLPQKEMKMTGDVIKALMFACALLGSVSNAVAQKRVTIEMNAISDKGIGKSVGRIVASETKNSFLRLNLKLNDELPSGGHGFHVHENGDCGPARKDSAMTAGLAAGGHYDPTKTGKHEGPSGDGHLGDLPILYIEPDEEDGTTGTTHSIVAPRLKLADIRGRSLVIHENSDNYDDEPKPLGGGGARIACGVVPE